MNEQEQSPPFSLSRLFRSSLLINLFSVAGATLVSRLLGLITLGYPARILGPEHFGIVSLGASTTSFASILLSPGLLTWGSREIAGHRDQAGKLLSAVNSLQFVLASIAYLSLTIYAFWMVPPGDTRSYILWIGLTLFLVGLSVDWVFNGMELMRVPALLNVAYTVGYTIALLTLVKKPADLMSMAWIQLGLTLPTILIGYGILTSKYKVGIEIPKVSDCWSAFKRSLPLGGTSALIIILRYANNLIIQSYLGLIALGVFSAAFRLIELIWTIPVVLQTVFASRLARLHKTDREKAISEAKKLVAVHALVGVFFAVLLLAESKGLIGMIYGKRYNEAIAPLSILSLSALSNFAICSSTTCLVPFGHDRVMIRIVVISAIVSVVGGLALVPMLGISGAAVIIGLIDLSGWAISLPYIRRHFGSYLLDAWIWPILAGCALFAASWCLHYFGLTFLWRLPILVLIYFVSTLGIIKSLFR